MNQATNLTKNEAGKLSGNGNHGDHFLFISFHIGETWNNVKGKVYKTLTPWHNEMRSDKRQHEHTVYCRVEEQRFVKCIVSVNKRKVDFLMFSKAMKRMKRKSVD